MEYQLLEKEQICIEELIDNFINSNVGKNTLEHYILTSQVKPKNIYTDSTDFYFRYNLELRILVQIFDNIDLPENIFSQIPELLEFYPIINNCELKKIKSKENSVSYILKLLDTYFSSINTREYGEYYSNEKLINILLDNLTIKFTSDLKVIDPSSGAGYILYNYLNRLLKLNPSTTGLLTIQNNIYGYDIFPFPIIISKILLGKLIETYDNSFIDAFTFKNIRIQNTLKTLECISDNKDKFDLIIGNPPYFRIDPHEENNICKCVSYGHNYIHSLFFHWCIQHLSEGGEFGLILPQSILSGFYYQKLRKEIMKETSIELIVTNKDHEKSFSVQQDIMIYLGRKSKKQTKQYAIGVSDSTFSRISKHLVSSNILKNSLKVIPLFKDRSEYENFTSLADCFIVNHLSSFKINTGNFVWNQNKDKCFYRAEHNTIPLINGPNVSLTGFNLENKRNSTFPYCKPDKEKYIKKDRLILYRRMSPIGNVDRMVASIIDTTDERFKNGYVIENHVNFISGPEEYLEDLLQFITSRNFNTLINSFCHTNQVSSNDLMTIFELLKNYKND